MTTTSKSRIFVDSVPGMGRGVFAGQPLQKGEVIETCPVILLSKPDVARVVETILDKYLFAWNDEQGTCCIALGFGSLYNHSPKPNAAGCRILDRNEIEFVALRDIEEGEQILTDYEWEEHEYHFPRHAD